MSEIKTHYDEELRRYKISGYIYDMDIFLDPKQIIQDVRDNITQALIDQMMAKLRERFESELNEALDTMFGDTQT